MWYDTETGISELPVTWSSNEHTVTIQGENLNLILPVSNVEGKIYLIAPNGERMENMSASSDDDDAATPTPEPTATPAPVPEDKYSEDGEACLVMDRDQVQIYLMGTYEAVSYTHLSFKALSAQDKRHAVVNWLLDHAMIIIILLLAVYVQIQRPQFFGVPSLVNIISLTAVSYTHLAVYKRQSWRCIWSWEAKTRRWPWTN